MSAQRTPTRDTMMHLRRQTEIVRFGKGLLEKKKDALLRAIDEDRRRLQKIERELLDHVRKTAYSYGIVRMFEGPSFIKLLAVGRKSVSVHSERFNLMGCTYYQYEPRKNREDIPFEEVSLDPALTSPYVDELVEHLMGTERLLWPYINLKAKLKALEKELKQTMRKVNTLEHTVLPDLKSDMKRIGDILGERERQERFAVKKFSKKKRAGNNSGKKGCAGDGRP